ncbi:hypothetical protein GE09DRAFT_157600 [Coniochaeta sp. 2T2.1]|nr:hypothetical protein GE09DRAFT_157600 [Coniochaeta sp. 2T2.1]
MRYLSVAESLLDRGVGQDALIYTYTHLVQLCGKLNSFACHSCNDDSQTLQKLTRHKDSLKALRLQRILPKAFPSLRAFQVLEDMSLDFHGLHEVLLNTGRKKILSDPEEIGAPFPPCLVSLRVMYLGIPESDYELPYKCLSEALRAVGKSASAGWFPNLKSVTVVEEENKELAGEFTRGWVVQENVEDIEEEEEELEEVAGLTDGDRCFRHEGDIFANAGISFSFERHPWRMLEEWDLYSDGVSQAR